MYEISVNIDVVLLIEFIGAYWLAFYLGCWFLQAFYWSRFIYKYDKQDEFESFAGGIILGMVPLSIFLYHLVLKPLSKLYIWNMKRK